MVTFNRSDFAGFWRRLVALFIDMAVVSIIVFPFALFIGFIAPNLILVKVPFGLFTTTTVVSENTEDQASIEKVEVLDLWTNYYKVKKEENDKGKVSTKRSLIDPKTELSIKKTSSSDIEFYVIFIYWILLEASIWQASVGKKIMGIKVVTPDGGKPDFFQCLARNVLKVISGLILFIGFFMVGWTNKKQGLHDKIPNLLLIKASRHSSLTQSRSDSTDVSN
ncbi:RDD family protein [Marinomonas sp. C2222]|uniref:RDD family protein n=1 Tax=Marinomonas sargassi TaxID=2984494 RepID=A0ABT2YTC1_9GAMM|nr:RDD family protein [Marinomonas sargassi]MCV2403142.1 RDD family protein [Marinomonas sargassi]